MSKKETIPNKKLTERESNILEAILESFREGDDLSNAAVANKLGIASDTLRVHKRNICSKFGLFGGNWWSAIKRARDEGVIPKQ